MTKAYQLTFPFMGDGGQIQSVMHVAGLIPPVKAAMQRALAAVNPPMSREQLVDKMNELAKLAGAKITADKSRALSLATLEKWLSVNDLDHFPPLPALEIFMIAVNSRAPLDVLASIHGYRLISPEEVIILEYGKARLASKKAGDKMRRLEKEIDHVRASTL
jgi:hypothetical protein